VIEATDADGAVFVDPGQVVAVCASTRAVRAEKPWARAIIYTAAGLSLEVKEEPEEVASQIRVGVVAS